MIDPTFGWGTIVIDELKSYFNWFGNLLYTKLIEQLFEYITGLPRTVIEAIRKSVSSVFDFFSGIWTEAKEAWDTTIKFYQNIREITLWLMDTFNWAYDYLKKFYKFCTDFVDWIFGKNDGFGTELGGMVKQLLDWFGDFIFGLWKRSQDFVFQNGQWLYEWLVGNLDKCVGYFINLINDIFNLIGLKVELPPTAFEGLMTFIQFGMFFDNFVPVKETFQLLGLYLIFVVMFSMVRFVRSLIPGFN